ncbi:uncharacterized protein [Manis javanica]|uniref:uncharacterized protein n=1 Tax=Manis javanica TaxID=9974 RepID=UPI003C6D3A17
MPNSGLDLRMRKRTGYSTLNTALTTLGGKHHELRVQTKAPDADTESSPQSPTHRNPRGLGARHTSLAAAAGRPRGVFPPPPCAPRETRQQPRSPPSLRARPRTRRRDPEGPSEARKGPRTAALTPLLRLGVPARTRRIRRSRRRCHRRHVNRFGRTAARWPRPRTGGPSVQNSSAGGFGRCLRKSETGSDAKSCPEENHFRSRGPRAGTARSCGTRAPAGAPEGTVPAVPALWRCGNGLRRSQLFYLARVAQLGPITAAGRQADYMLGEAHCKMKIQEPSFKKSPGP